MIVTTIIGADEAAFEEGRGRRALIVGGGDEDAHRAHGRGRADYRAGRGRRPVALAHPRPAHASVRVLSYSSDRISISEHRSATCT